MDKPWFKFTAANWMSEYDKREAEPMIPYAMITIGVIALGVWMGMD